MVRVMFPTTDDNDFIVQDNRSVVTSHSAVWMFVIISYLQVRKVSKCEMCQSVKVWKVLKVSKCQSVAPHIGKVSPGRLATAPSNAVAELLVPSADDQLPSVEDGESVTVSSWGEGDMQFNENQTWVRQ